MCIKNKSIKKCSLSCNLIFQEQSEDNFWNISLNKFIILQATFFLYYLGIFYYIYI